jgi:predicted permease
MTVSHDIRFAFRTLRRNPGYTFAALLTLMLGIGANAAVFSVVYGILMSPLPFPEPDRLVRVWDENSAGRPMDTAWVSFLDWHERARSFDALFAHTSGGASTVLLDGAPMRVGVVGVSDGFTRTMGVSPRLGRPMLSDEHVLHGAPAVLVSDAFWRTHLGATTDIAGRHLTVAGFDAQVVGVMPPGFEYPGDVDIWYPIELNEQSDSRTSHNYRVIGRLRAGATTAVADAELDGITGAFLTDNPGAASEDGFADYFPRSARVLPLRDAMVGDTGRPLWILLGASVLVLLVACVNLASATLARATAREREYAVRRSLGASRPVLLRQLFTESLVLALAGGALALLLAAAAIRALPALAPAGIPRIDEVSLNPMVIGAALFVSFVTAVLFGLVPALRVTGDAGTLRGGGRGGTERGRQRVWKILVAAEVALALMLLIGSGLLIRSFQTVLGVEPGFRTEGLLMATVDPPESSYPTFSDRGVYYDRLLDALRAVPGVARVGVVNNAPMAGVSNGLVSVRGGPAPTVTGDYQLVGGDYFEVLDIPLVAGRFFDGRERADGEHVVIVNRAFAALAWPGEDAVGKQMTGGGMDNYWNQEKWATVIGVVADVRQEDLTEPANPTYYFAVTQRPFRSWSMSALIAPAAGSASALGPGVREGVRSVNDQVPVELTTIEARVSGALVPRRFTMLVLGVFSAVALALACVGIWGIVSYAVARRTREIGIRMALGADAGSVRRLLQLDYLRPVMIGTGLGLLAALALTRVLSSLLYETPATDPLTFATVVLVLAGAAWVASFVPARRGTRISPMETMRSV